MKRFTWRTNLIIALIAASVVFYLINYFIFRDPPFMFRLLTLQLGFVPIQVVLITFLLNELLGRREKRARLERLNMVIGAFFSEVGTALIASFSSFDPHREQISRALIVNPDWSDQDFASARIQAKNYDYRIGMHTGNLEELRDFLIEKRIFLLRLLENPNLLEHESFTDLLWAVFHLIEELDYRKSFDALIETDHKHLNGDAERAYSRVIGEWVDYMEHLRNNYPYLFSLSVRMNPFNPQASPTVG